MRTLAQLNQADRPAFVAALGHLFEHSPWVADETWSRRPFRDGAHLHAELCVTMRAASRARQLALIRAHPDLAGRLAPQRKLTAESTREQASAGRNTLDHEAALADGPHDPAVRNDHVNHRLLTPQGARCGPSTPCRWRPARR